MGCCSMLEENQTNEKTVEVKAKIGERIDENNNNLKNQIVEIEVKKDEGILSHSDNTKQKEEEKITLILDKKIIIDEIKKEEKNENIIKDLSIKSIEEEKKEENQIKQSNKQIINIEEEIKPKIQIIEIEKANKNKNILLGIKSTILLKSNIINYISKKRKLGLFIYSNVLKKRLNIYLKDYIYNYLGNLIEMKDYNYLVIQMQFPYGIDSINKTKNLYLSYLNKIKCEEKIFQDFIVSRFEEADNNNYFCQFGPPINISSPIFDLILKRKLIMKFKINIDQEFSKNTKLFNDLYNAIKTINENSYMYPQISISLNSNELDLIKKLNLNFDKIKTLNLYNPSDNCDGYSNKILSLINNKENLEYLIIHSSNSSTTSLDILNEFKNLKILDLEINCLEKFTLKLNNLNILDLSKIKNIAFDENLIYRVKNLKIMDSEIVKPKTLLKFP